MSSSQKLLALLVGACLLSLIAADYKCTPDKKWHECACNKDHYCGGKGPGCTYGCKEGCVCKDPKHRLHDNACIPADKCPGNCPQGAEWSKCSGCKDHNCGGNYVDCKIRCNPGCVCNNPKYRLHNNECIPADKCPDYCPPDMVWSDCSGCKDECQGNNVPCTTKCEKRCVCKASGYKLRDNKCIPEATCPGNCPQGAEWQKCSGCKDHNCGGKGMDCTHGCDNPGCVCEKGYKLHDNKCIPAKDCPGYCPPGAKWSDCCGCNDQCQKQGTVCKAGCTKGCKCENKEHRLHNNECIHHTKCPDYCPPGSKWSDCCGCNDQCQKQDTVCTAVCTKGCKCENKEHRLHNNECVHYKDCPGYCPRDAEWSKCSGCNGHDCGGKDMGCKDGCCVCKNPQHRLHDNRCIHHKECRSWGGNH